MYILLDMNQTLGLELKKFEQAIPILQKVTPLVTAVKPYGQFRFLFYVTVSTNVMLIPRFSQDSENIWF